MDRRNIFSVVLIGLVLVNAVLATTITIRNFDTIVQEFEDIFEHKGILDIFFTSNISQQIETQVEGLKLLPLPVINQTYEILEVWINIKEIGLVGRDTSNFTVFQSSNLVNLYEGVNTSKFLKSVNVTEGDYSAVFLFFDENIHVVTTEGSIDLIFTDKNFVVVPFVFLDNEGLTGNLDIRKDQTSQILLSFEMIIIWPINSVVITIISFLL